MPTTTKKPHILGFVLLSRTINAAMKAGVESRKLRSAVKEKLNAKAKSIEARLPHVGREQKKILAKDLSIVYDAMEAVDKVSF